MKRVRSVAAIAGLLVMAGGLAACGKSSGAPAADAPISGQTITLYNGQHEQTTNALVDAFTKQTGVKVKVRSDDEDVLAQQIQQEGSKSPADVFFTENTPAAGSPRRGQAALTGRRLDPRRGAGGLQRRRPQLGRRLGPGQRHRLQHRQAQALAAAQVDPRSRRPAVEGQARHRAGRDRLRPDRHLDRRKPR